MSWSRKVGEKISYFLGLESSNRNYWKGLRNIRKLPCDVVLGKLSELVVFFIWRPLFVYRSVIII